MKKFLVFLISILVILFLFVVGYIFYKHLSLEKNNTPLYEFSNFEYNANNTPKNWDFINGFMLKKITTYNEYRELKETYNNIPDVLEEKFDKNYLVVIFNENYNLSNISAAEVTNTDNKFKIKLISNNSTTQTNKPIGITLLISNSMACNQIEIQNTATINKTNNYNNIENLPKDYSVESAIKDNCLVIISKESKTYNKEILENFIKDVNNNISANIRIYQKIKAEDILITDISYNPIGQFIITDDHTRRKQLDFTYNSQAINTNKIDIFPNNTLTLYTIKDSNNTYEFVAY